MSRRKGKAPPSYRTHDMTRDMDYQPKTPPGSTRLELENCGSFRPGKTEQDYMPVQERPRFKAWQSRLSRANVACADVSTNP